MKFGYIMVQSFGVPPYDLYVPLHPATRKGVKANLHMSVANPADWRYHSRAITTSMSPSKSQKWLFLVMTRDTKNPSLFETLDLQYQTDLDFFRAGNDLTEYFRILNRGMDLVYLREYDPREIQRKLEVA